MSYKNLPDQQASNLRAAYQQLCTSYRAIDDFRTKLLGFLPLATGAGIFLLIANEEKMNFAKEYFWAIGAFGFVVTLGLFCFELHGIKKCTHLIKAGEDLEKRLGIEKGQFKKRPRGFAGFINEPFAAGVIYPAVLAAWTFLALVFPPPHKCSSQLWTSLTQDGAKFWAIRVFFIGFVFLFLYDLRLILDEKISNVIVYLKTRFKRLAKREEKPTD